MRTLVFTPDDLAVSELTVIDLTPFVPGEDGLELVFATFSVIWVGPVFTVS